MTLDPHEAYALCNRHASHRHMGDDLAACRDWMPAAIECDRAALDEADETQNVLAAIARKAEAELAELRATLAALAAEADARIGDEYADRQLIAEHLVDRLIVLSGGGK